MDALWLSIAFFLSISMAQWTPDITPKQHCTCRRCSVGLLLILNIFTFSSELVIRKRGTRVLGKRWGCSLSPPHPLASFFSFPLTSFCPSLFSLLICLMTSRCDCWLPRPHPEDAGSVPPQTQDQRLGWGWGGGCNPSTTSGDEEKENFEVLWIKPVNNNSR